MVTLSKKGNTTIVNKTVGGYKAVILYYTTIVAWNDKEIILNTGGFETNTTKQRMNQTAQEFNLDFSVFQKKGVWYVNYKGEVVEFKTNTVTLTR